MLVLGPELRGERGFDLVSPASRPVLGTRQRVGNASEMSQNWGVCEAAPVPRCGIVGPGGRSLCGATRGGDSIRDRSAVSWDNSGRRAGCPPTPFLQPTALASVITLDIFLGLLFLNFERTLQ